MTTTQSMPLTASLLAEGHAQLHAGRFREAEQLYRQTLNIDPGHPEALAFLGMIAGQAGHLQDAVKLFERALKRASRNADIHHNLGET
jgi:Flp pilus assembly protein TadD